MRSTPRFQQTQHWPAILAAIDFSLQLSGGSAWANPRTPMRTHGQLETEDDGALPPPAVWPRATERNEGAEPESLTSRPRATRTVPANAAGHPSILDRTGSLVLNPTKVAGLNCGAHWSLWAGESPVGTGADLSTSALSVSRAVREHDSRRVRSVSSSGELTGHAETPGRVHGRLAGIVAVSPRASVGASGRVVAARCGVPEFVIERPHFSTPR